MKVTPITKKFGRHAPGDVFDLPGKTARLLIKVGKLQAVEDSVPEAIAVASVIESSPEANGATEVASPDADGAADVPADAEVAEDATPGPSVASEPSARRQYRRRDMAAESAGKATPRKVAKKAVRKPAGPKKD